MLATPPTPRARAVDLTAGALRRDILCGKLKPGDPLPPERQLAQTLGVSRLTLRAALARLEGECLVRPQQGSGTRVLDYREHGGMELLGPLLEAALAGGEVPIALLAQILEVRRGLAVEAFGLAAERATPDELGALAEHLRAQACDIGSPRAFMENDLELARRLVRAAHNLPLELLFNTIARAIRTRPGLEQLFVVVHPELSLAFYQKLLAYLRAGDAQAARRAAARLIERHDRHLIAQLSVQGASHEAAHGPAMTCESQEVES